MVAIICVADAVRLGVNLGEVLYGVHGSKVSV